MTDVVTVDEIDGVALITLNRPHVRNAISGELLVALRASLAACDASHSVRVIVLTGADPAFCAGLDLRSLSAGDPILVEEASTDSHPPWPPTVKPIIGAINGPAVAGGLELALNCDILIASTRATFADTHARVAVMPGWGLSARLPAAVGRQLATSMSLTGRPITADRALLAGLVCAVVAHEDLHAEAMATANDIAGADDDAVRALLASYREIERAVHGPAFDVESASAKAFRAGGLDLAVVHARKDDIIGRGSELHGSGSK